MRNECVLGNVTTAQLLGTFQDIWNNTTNNAHALTFCVYYNKCRILLHTTHISKPLNNRAELRMFTQNSPYTVLGEKYFFRYKIRCLFWGVHTICTTLDLHAAKASKRQNNTPI